MTTVINVKTDPEIKIKAQHIAQELGFSLSSLVNAYLRQLIKTKTVTFSLSDEEPTEYLLDMLEESREDNKAGRVSPTFSTPGEAINWLDKETPEYEGKI